MPARPGEMYVGTWLPQTEADELTVLAHTQQVSRSELLRRVLRAVLSHNDQEHI
jgi:metal-responsive CopG/Arc/MetJ family transcriptional regulator